jgi:hypothetical protein
VDPIESGALVGSENFNLWQIGGILERYAYADGNPVNKKDPEGLISRSTMNTLCKVGCALTSASEAAIAVIVCTPLPPPFNVLCFAESGAGIAATYMLCVLLCDRSYPCQ